MARAMMMIMMMVVYRMRAALDVPSVQLETTTLVKVGGIVKRIIDIFAVQAIGINGKLSVGK